MLQTHASFSSFDSAKYPKPVTPAEIRAHYALLEALPSQVPASRIREELTSLSRAQQCEPEDLLHALKRIPAIAFLYAQDSRIIESYTIEEHTSMVLRQIEQHLRTPRVELPVSVEELRIAAALHDIGKPLPDEKRNQHPETFKILRGLGEILPLSANSREIIESLIKSDPIGKLIVSSLEKQATIEQRRTIAARAETQSLTGRELKEFADLVEVKDPSLVEEKISECVLDITTRAQVLGISARSLFNLHVLFYQADTSAYTYDAVAHNGRRASPGLEFIYELDESFDISKEKSLLISDAERGLLKFSSSVDRILRAAEARLR